MRPAAQSSRIQTRVPPTEFFIVGCPRSGTTLLRFMLDEHPDMAVVPETHFGVEYVNKRERGGRRIDPHTRAGLVDEFCRSSVFGRMGIDERAVRAVVESDPLDPWLPLQAAMHEFARRRYATIVGEKTPSHALQLGVLAKAFPDARFLLISRDPRAVAASWLRTSWSGQSTLEVAETWTRYARSMRESVRRLPERCLEIRYETLVASPETELKSICAFLGADFDSRMLSYFERSTHPECHSIPADEGVDNPLTFARPDSSRIDAWRRELSPRDQTRVEAVCGRAMLEHGYEPETALRRRLPIAMAAAPRSWRRRLARTLRAGPASRRDPVS